MVARYVSLGGAEAVPERLKSRTPIVLAPLTRIVPIKPAGSVAGHPPATASPVTAPVTRKSVRSHSGPKRCWETVKVLGRHTN
jgi:hypothetical protein